MAWPEAMARVAESSTRPMRLIPGRISATVFVRGGTSFAANPLTR
jgi:hypothetical protein